MNTRTLEKQFERMGARALFHPMRQGSRSPVRIDIGRDAEGEFFDIAVRKTECDILVVDIQPKLRHLLLMAKQDDEKSKFLCGHDERHWFVAAVPERRPVSTIRTAFEALKPATVLAEEIRLGVKPQKRQRRRNAASIRQGEWFFVPQTGFRPAENALIFRNEPISRGLGSKPHLCEELVRQGGEVVYVAKGYPMGLREGEYRDLLNRHPRAANLHWKAQRRNARVYVRGRVRHADHKTIVLRNWHRVIMNTENESVAMRHVSFID